MDGASSESGTTNTLQPPATVNNPLAAMMPWECLEQPPPPIKCPRPSDASSPLTRVRVSPSILSAIASNVSSRSGRGVVSRSDMVELDSRAAAGAGGDGGGEGGEGAPRSGEEEAADGDAQDNASGKRDRPPARRFVLASGAPDVLPGGQYEYLDHTADVQLHSWGSTLSEALSWLVVSLFGYMTDLQTVKVDAATSEANGGPMKVYGHDLHTLLFHLLDEWLYVFHSTGFVCREVEVSGIKEGGEGGHEEDDDDGGEGKSWELMTSGRGELFDMEKHPQGTEVKAITYSNMQVVRTEGRVDVYVIVDI